MNDDDIRHLLAITEIKESYPGVVVLDFPALRRLLNFFVVSQIPEPVKKITIDPRVLDRIQVPQADDDAPIENGDLLP